jgi:hypothetical protein
VFGAVGMDDLLFPAEDLISMGVLDHAIFYTILLGDEIFAFVIAVGGQFLYRGLI